MRKMYMLSVHWGDEFGKPPKTPEQKQREARFALEVLQQVKQMPKVKIVEIRSEGYTLEVEVGSEAFKLLIDGFQKAPHLVSPTRVWKIYTRQELESAELLIWRLTNQAIGDDYYKLEGIEDYVQRCEACSAPLKQVRDLLVDVRKMGKRDLSLTYAFEVILSPQLAQRLQEAGFSGFTLRPVWDYRKPYQGEPRLFQLVVTNRLPPMASPPTEFEEDWPRPKQCTVCGRQAYYLKHIRYWGKIRYYEEGEVYYHRSVLEQAQDFNIATERFGELRGSHQMIIISQRVYRWLREQRIKGWAVEPVYLVE